MKSSLLFLFGLFLTVISSQADGIPYNKDGHFLGEGKTSTLTLTGKQLEVLRAAQKSGSDIDWDTSHSLELTKDQKEILNKSAGVAPTRLTVYNTLKGENDCSCSGGFWNIALWAEGQTIEVPHTYLVTDKEAERLQKRLETD